MRTSLAVCAMVLPLLASDPALAQAGPPAAAEWARARTPLDGAEVVGRRPAIAFELAAPADRATLVVLLDGADVTALLEAAGGGWAFRPAVALPAGAHVLSLSATGAGGTPLQKVIQFTSRHAAAVDEYAASADLTLAYARVLAKPGAPKLPATTPPQTATPPSTATGFTDQLQGNVKLAGTAKAKGFTLSLAGDVRVLAQDVPVTAPASDGVDLASWLVSLAWAGGGVKAAASLGDQQVQETANTIGLCRKGAQLQLDGGWWQLRGFSLESQQAFGATGGAGLGLSPEDHVLGASAGLALLEGRLGLKGLWLDGAGSNPAVPVVGPPPPPQLGTANGAGAARGELVALVVTSNLLQERLKTELELDLSSFTPDAASRERRRDHAWLARLGGALGPWSYDARGEYFGADYGSVGALGVLRDRLAGTLTQGLVLGPHVASLVLGIGHDNVAGDPLLATTTQRTGALTYGFTGVPALPLSLSWQLAAQRSADLPPGTAGVDSRASTLAASASWVAAPWGLGASATWTALDDRTAAGADATSVTAALTPSLTLPALAAAPSVAWTRSRSGAAGAWTSALTATVTATARTLAERLSFDLSGSWTTQLADDRSADTRQLNAGLGATWDLKDALTRFLRPALTLRGAWWSTRDAVSPAVDGEGFGLTLVLTVQSAAAL